MLSRACGERSHCHSQAVVESLYFKCVPQWNCLCSRASPGTPVSATGLTSVGMGALLLSRVKQRSRLWRFNVYGCVDV